VTFSRVEWERRRAADRDLDRRLGRLGFKPSSGFHADTCALGVAAGANCTCREVVARESRRRRPHRRGGLLTR
jgi:hypothetical protein